jgi:ABC-type sugar transport system ATPase subunit
MLEVKNLSFSYQNAAIFSDISFSVKEKEILHLYGPSGVGKSTLIDLIAGHKTPSRGNIFIDGEIVNSAKPQARPTACMFQSPMLFPNMKVETNILLPFNKKLIFNKKIQSQDKDFYQEVVHFLEIQNELTKYPEQLSGGQKQRVALARSLMTKPKVLLLDEPLSALDQALRKKALTLLNAIPKRFGPSVVYIGHDLSDLYELDGKIFFMGKQRHHFFSSLKNLHKEPISQEVVEFFQLGCINSSRQTFTPVESLSFERKSPRDQSATFKIMSTQKLGGYYCYRIKPKGSEKTLGIVSENYFEKSLNLFFDHAEEKNIEIITKEF